MPPPVPSTTPPSGEVAAGPAAPMTAVGLGPSAMFVGVDGPRPTVVATMPPPMGAAGAAWAPRTAAAIRGRPGSWLIATSAPRTSVPAPRASTSLKRLWGGGGVGRGSVETVTTSGFAGIGPDCMEDLRMGWWLAGGASPYPLPSAGRRHRLLEKVTVSSRALRDVGR